MMGRWQASSKARAIPAFVVPMAAQAVSKLPEGDEWLYELKVDGSPY
jgi:ATP-dependent DNA ligase